MNTANKAKTQSFSLNQLGSLGLSAPVKGLVNKLY